IELQAGVMPHHDVGPDRRGQRYLIEARVSLRPEYGSPAAVQLFDRAVFAFQIGVEGLARRLAEIVLRLAAELVVELPGHDIRMVSGTLRHQANDSQRVREISLRMVRAVLAGPETDRSALLVHRKNIGTFLSQPDGRTCRRRTEHDAKAMRPRLF